MESTTDSTEEEEEEEDVDTSEKDLTDEKEDAVNKVQGMQY